MKHFLNAAKNAFPAGRKLSSKGLQQAAMVAAGTGIMLLNSAFATDSSAATGKNISDGICTVTYNIGVPVIFAVGVVMLIRGIIAMSNSRDGVMGLGVGGGMIVMALFAKDIVKMAYDVAPDASTFKTSMKSSKCIA